MRLGQGFAAACLVALGACTPTPPGGVFECTTAADCPADFACVDRFCERGLADASVDSRVADAADAGDTGGDIPDTRVPDTGVADSGTDTGAVCDPSAPTDETIVLTEGGQAPIVDDLTVTPDGTAFVAMHGLERPTGLQAWSSVTGVDFGMEGDLVLRLDHTTGTHRAWSVREDEAPAFSIENMAVRDSALWLGGRVGADSGWSGCPTPAVAGSYGFALPLNAPTLTIELGTQCTIHSPMTVVSAIGATMTTDAVVAGADGSAGRVLHLQREVGADLVFGDDGEFDDLTVIGDRAFAVGRVVGDVFVGGSLTNLLRHHTFVLRVALSTSGETDRFVHFGGHFQDRARGVVTSSDGSDVYIVGQLDSNEPSNRAAFIAHYAGDLLGSPEIDTYPASVGGWESVAYRASDDTLFVAGIFGLGLEIGGEMHTGIVVASFHASTRELRWVRSFAVDVTASNPKVRVGTGASGCCVDVAGPFIDRSIVKRICE